MAAKSKADKPRIEVPELSGPKKAALVILSLEEELAGEVLRNLDERDLKCLAATVDALDPVPYEALDPTLEAFEKRLGEPLLPTGGSDYMRRIAVHALGADRAKNLFDPEPVPPKPLEMIGKAKAATLAELLQDEHPQVAAVIISQLPQEQASKVILAMREDKQPDLIVRIANLKEVPEQALEVASQTLLDALADAGGLPSQRQTVDFDGVAYAAALMNELPTDDNERLLEELEDAVPELAPKIREAMFTFEDLGGLDARSVQTLMREVSSEQLLVALKTASETLRDKFLSAVSSRAAETMREDLELMPPKRLSEVEEAQRAVVDTAMRLASDGQITMPGGSGDEMV